MISFVSKSSNIVKHHPRARWVVMPPKSSRRFAKKRAVYKRRRAPARFSRVRKSPRYNGMARITRVTNPALYGLSTDNTVLSLTGASGYLQYVGSALAGAVTYGSMHYTASLGTLGGWTEFQNLYEKYRIDKIQFRIIPLATSATTGGAANAATTQAAVLFHYCVDPDDAVLPTPNETGLMELREKQGYRTRNIYASSGRPIVITYRPRITAPVYQTGLVAAYQDKGRQWLDTDYQDIPHYGIKFICESVSAGASQTFFFKVEAKYFMSFRGVQ